MNEGRNGRRDNLLPLPCLFLLIMSLSNWHYDCLSTVNVITAAVKGDIVVE